MRIPFKMNMSGAFDCPKCGQYNDYKYVAKIATPLPGLQRDEEMARQIGVIHCSSCNAVIPATHNIDWQGEEILEASS